MAGTYVWKATVVRANGDRSAATVIAPFADDVLAALNARIDDDDVVVHIERRNNRTPRKEDIESGEVRVVWHRRNEEGE